MPDASLIAESLSKSYPTRRGPLTVLNSVSLRLDSGQSASIVGPSGSGKSTLLNILGGLEPPTAGTLTLAGKNPYTLADADLAHFRNRQVGFIFQDHHLLPQCSVLENVLIPTLAERSADDPLPRARDLIARVGLSDRADHLPAELSGGERQRAAVARALINRPALLLADEPTGNLDRASAAAVADLILDLHRSQGTILIVVTHNPELAARFQLRYEMNDGRLM